MFPSKKILSSFNFCVEKLELVCLLRICGLEQAQATHVDWGPLAGISTSTELPLWGSENPGVAEVEGTNTEEEKTNCCC